MQKFLDTLKKIGKSFVEMIVGLFSPKSRKKQLSVLEEEAMMSPGRVIAKNFLRNKLAIVGLSGLFLIFFFSFGLSFFFPLNIYESNALQRNLPPAYNYLNYPKQLVREGVVDIQSGISFSVGLSEAGKLYVWGSDTRGIAKFPQEMMNKEIAQFAVGSQHIIVLTTDGELFAWGHNHQGQGSIPDSFTMPYKTIFETDKPVKVFAGTDKTAVITESGQFYIWGSVLASRLDSSPYRFFENNDNTQPIIDIVHAEISYANVIFLLEDGTVRIVGSQGELRMLMPEYLRDGSVTITQVGIADRSSGFAVDDTGSLHTWGGISERMVGVFVPEEAKTDIRQLTTGDKHVVVVKNDNTVIAWGTNVVNQTDVPSKIANGSTNIDTIFTSYYQNYAMDENGELTAWGNKGFLAGTDDEGRDFIVQLIHGGRITLTVGAVAVIISTIIGVTVGLTAGFYGGRVDNLLMRFGEIVNSFPFLPLALTLSVLLLGRAVTQNQRLLMIMVILGILSWPGLARLIRGQILSERERDFVLAAKALGIKERHIIVRHILPAVISIVIVNMTLGYAGSLLTEAGLSFLGFGVQTPTPSWGNILTAAQQSTSVLQYYWWRWLLPAVGILTAALSVNLIGDALRDAMDPKSNER